VEKQRRLANNLVPVKKAAPVEMGAVWTVPDAASGAKAANDRVKTGNFLVDHGQIVAQANQQETSALKGHDFSRAVGSKNQMRASAPEGQISRNQTKFKPGPKASAPPAPPISSGKGQ
jgi:hypothetical protein